MQAKSRTHSTVCLIPHRAFLKFYPAFYRWLQFNEEPNRGGVTCNIGGGQYINYSAFTGLSEVLKTTQACP